MQKEIIHDFVIENGYYSITKHNCYTIYIYKGQYTRYGTLQQVFWFVLGELYNDMNIYKLGLNQCSNV